MDEAVVDAGGEGVDMQSLSTCFVVALVFTLSTEHIGACGDTRSIRVRTQPAIQRTDLAVGWGGASLPCTVAVCDGGGWGQKPVGFVNFAVFVLVHGAVTIFVANFIFLSSPPIFLLIYTRLCIVSFICIIISSSFF